MPNITDLNPCLYLRKVSATWQSTISLLFLLVSTDHILILLLMKWQKGCFHRKSQELIKQNTGTLISCFQARISLWTQGHPDSHTSSTTSQRNNPILGSHAETEAVMLDMHIAERELTHWSHVYLLICIPSQSTLAQGFPATRCT